MLPDWEIWLDNHISPITAKWLSERFDLNVKSSYALQTYTFSDHELYNKAKQSGNVIIITKDSDLEDIVDQQGTPPKLISLKVGNCDNRILFSIIATEIEKALRLLIDFDKEVIFIRTTD